MKRKTVFILCSICIGLFLLLFSYRLWNKQTTITTETEELYLIKENGKYGYINKYGDVIIPSQFDNASAYSFFYGDVTVVSTGEKEGLIDRKGKYIIDPVYDNLSVLSTDRIIAKTEEGYLLIDYDGNLVNELQFDEISSSRTGDLIRFNNDGKYGFIDRHGNVVIESQFENCGEIFECNRCWFIENEKYGFINSEGVKIITPQYANLGSHYKYGFQENLALMSDSEKIICIDTIGIVRFEINAEDAGFFSYGVAPVTINNKIGFINKEGEFPIQPEFDEVGHYFSEGMRWFKKESKYGYLDSLLNVVIDPIFDEALNFEDGIAVVKMENHYGVINTSGTFICMPKYDYIHSFREGLSKVEENGKYGFMNKKCELVIPLIFDNAGDFIFGIAEVMKNNTHYYIDKKGEIIYTAISK